MPQICKQALERPICMLLGEELGPVVVPAVHSTFWWSSVEPTELRMTCTVHINNRVLCIMWMQERHSALEKWFLNSSGWSIYPVHAVSVGASTFLTITQTSFLQMLLLTSFAWHQVRNADRDPKCLKATGCSQTLLCCVNFYVSFFQMWDLQLSLTWNKLLYHNPLCLLPPFLALTLMSWHQDSIAQSAGNGLWTLSTSNFIYMHDMMQWV